MGKLQGVDFGGAEETIYGALFGVSVFGLMLSAMLALMARVRGPNVRRVPEPSEYPPWSLRGLVARLRLT